MSAFISYDREDSNGVRAEIYVSTFTGTVKKFDDSNEKSAQFAFNVEWLDHAPAGWVGKEEEIYPILMEAAQSKAPLNIRLESRRRKKVSRTTPISELRATAEIALKTVTSVIVAVNDIYSTEALTHPSEDPVTEARPALPKNSTASSQNKGNNITNTEDMLKKLQSINYSRELPQSIIDAVAAQTLLAGASSSDIMKALTKNDEAPQLQASFSTEAPGFKPYNSDGRVNLGASAVQTILGVHTFVSDVLRDMEQKLTLDQRNILANLILAIADKIQSTAYGEGFRPDRTAGSHTRVRSVIYDNIRHQFLLPVENDAIISAEKVNSWVQSVGLASRTQFFNMVRMIQETPPTIAQLLQHLENQQSGQTENTSSQPKPEPANEPENPETEPVSDIPEEPVEEEIVVSAPQSVTPEPEVADAETEVAQTESSEAEASEVTEEIRTAPTGPVRMEQKILPPGAITSDNAPAENDIEFFKNFVQEFMQVSASSDLKKVGALLAYTFGPSYNKAQNVPVDELYEFIDFYTAVGDENFHQVLSTLP